MPPTGNLNKRALRQWFTDCRTFFARTAKVSSERNWELLHPMSLVYLAYLCVYLFVFCPILDIALQTSAVRLFTLLHAVFTLWVFLRGRKAPPVRAVNLAITLFAAQILGLSGFLGIAVFPTEASFMFPLCLVLMTQIYTRRLIYPVLEVLVPSAVYLFCCWLNKDTYVFILDAVSISIAVGIAGAALFSSANYKLRAYHAQLALQKMCALDPMTRVNNKPTFEFLVEDYLRSCPAGGHALGLCDFDDFKSINDRHGHRMGDEVLDAFAVRLHTLVDGDPNLIAGRFGGDEFVVFIKQYSSQQSVMQKLSVLCAVPGFDFAVTCSIGVAFSSTGSAQFRQYFDAADRCLYKAKAARTGSLCSADADAVSLPPSAD